MKNYNLISKEIYILKNKEEYKSKDNEYIVENEYKRRMEMPGVRKFDFEIFPFSFREQKRLSKKYPLFFISFPEHLYLVERIYGKSKVIENTLLKIPKIVADNIMKKNIVEEIQGSNEIEGVKSTRKEISIAIKENDSSVKYRFWGVVKQYLMTMNDPKKMIHNIEDFRKIYDIILDGELEDEELPDGKIFRKDSVVIDNNSGDGKFVHTGDKDEAEIQENIRKLISVINDVDISPLIKSIVCHYILEYIHPFYEGNGRLGRYIMSSYLSFKLDKFTALSINQAIYMNKKKYESSFSEVSDPRNRGDLTLFILNMLEIIFEGQEKIIYQLNEALETLSEIDDYIESKKLSGIHRDIFRIILQNHHFSYSEKVISNMEIKEALNISRTKVDKIMKELEVMGLVEQVFKNPLVYKLVEL